MREADYLRMPPVVPIRTSSSVLRTSSELVGDEAADAASESDHDDSSNALAITALVVGGVALFVSVIALVRRPRTGG